MSRHISPAHKVAVMALLDANGADVPQTALQTGIAERTLYRWKRQYTLSLLPQEGRQSLALPMPASDGQEDEKVEFIRSNLWQAALEIAAQLPDSVYSPELLRRVSALNGLLERLTVIRKEVEGTKPKVIEIRRVRSNELWNPPRKGQVETIHTEVYEDEDSKA
jgi:transposase-like protein